IEGVVWDWAGGEAIVRPAAFTLAGAYLARRRSRSLLELLLRMAEDPGEDRAARSQASLALDLAYGSPLDRLPDYIEPGDQVFEWVLGYARERRRKGGAPRGLRAGDRHERVLRDLDRADALHAPLPCLLPLEQLALAGHVAAVALGEDVLAHGRDGLPGDDLAADRRLQRHVEELAWNYPAELLDEAPAVEGRPLPLDDHRKGIHGRAGDQDVQLDQIARFARDQLIVHRRVPA